MGEKITVRCRVFFSSFRTQLYNSIIEFLYNYFVNKGLTFSKNEYERQLKSFVGLFSSG